MTIDIGMFLLWGFFIYRLSFLVSREEGPFSILSMVRGRIDPHQNTWIGRGINCPICISFWLSLIPGIFLSSNVSLIPLTWFAIAGLAAFLERVSV